MTVTNTITLTVEPLTKEAFTPFGDVIDKAASDYFLINNGSTRRYHQLANVDVSENGGVPIISIFQATPLAYPLQIQMMERHPLGSQAFIPLLGHPYLLVVAEKGDGLKPQGLRAFLSNGKQGVNYHKGVWHHPVLALQPDDQFLIVDRAGEEHNCDEVHFDESTSVILSLDNLPSVG